MTVRSRFFGTRGRREARPESGTVSSRINAERLVLLGWPRAVLLQFAHPLIAAGVYDHSNFRSTPWAAAQRLKHTVRAMLSLTFGNEPEQECALERIRAIHRRVNGTLRVDVGPFAAGTRYSAEDPELVLWVHATLIESLPIIYALLEAPLTMAERDAYCDEAAPVAVALNARQDDTPRSWAELRAYLDDMYASGKIVVGPQARELATRILSRPFGLLGAPAASVTRLLTLGVLPECIRKQYGFEWTRREERAFSIAATGLRSFRQVLPDALATWGAARRHDPAAGSTRL
jgi:uncharacterized protein (DUF2236 family)